MKLDVRTDPVYKDIQEYFARIYAGSFGLLAECWEIQASRDARWIALAGTSYDDLNGLPRSRIALFDSTSAAMTMIESERNDTAPRWSPDSARLAFLSDRSSPDRYAAYLCEPKERRVKPFAPISGSAESIAWAPGGLQVFVQTVASATPPDDLPDWTPEVEKTVPDDAWRRIWIYDKDGGSPHLLDWLGVTVWEAAWCGNDAIVAVVSDNPREAGWFQARLVYIDLQRKTCETIYEPSSQIGLPLATDDGRYVALVEGCCSDRGIVAGDALLLDRMLGWRSGRIDTANVDVTFLCSRDATHFTFAGVRDFDVACGDISPEDGAAEIAITTSDGWMRLYPGVAPVALRDYATVAQRYASPPALVRYASGTEKPHTLHAFSYEGSAFAIEHAGEFVRRSWSASDGLEIHGYLAQPRFSGPHPLVILLHGGPVWSYTNTWCLYGPIIPLLVKNGYAVFLPNPRGSSGRGQTFARLVCGDLGGDECKDILYGIQSLVDDGVIDETRLAVAGGSHGGYLTAALISQTDIFAAAICGFPVVDIFSGNITGYPSEAMPPFIDGKPFDVHSQYFSRSPIMQTESMNTPVLIIAGGRDRLVGITQGLELHRALAQRGAQSELVTYPLEGHGVRNTAAYIDYCTRILEWLRTYLPSDARSRTS